MSELAKQMKEHGIRNPWNLTEFDQWVNDATRADIERILQEHHGEIFGLKCWTWEIIEAEKLKDVYNFGVDYLFKNSDREKIKLVIDAYEANIKKSGWNTKKDIYVIDVLSGISIDSCLWV